MLLVRGSTATNDTNRTDIARYRQVGYWTVGKRSTPTGIWPIVGFKKWHKDARDSKNST